MSPKPHAAMRMARALARRLCQTAIAEMAFSPIHPPRHLCARVLCVTWRECRQTRRRAVSPKPRVLMQMEKAPNPLQSQTKIAEMAFSPTRPLRHLCARVLCVTWRECPRTRRLAVSPRLLAPTLMEKGPKALQSRTLTAGLVLCEMSHQPLFVPEPCAIL